MIREPCTNAKPFRGCPFSKTKPPPFYYVSLLLPSRNRFPFSLHSFSSFLFFFKRRVEVRRSSRWIHPVRGIENDDEFSLSICVCVCFDVIILADIPAKVSITRPIESYHSPLPSVTTHSCVPIHPWRFFLPTFRLDHAGANNGRKGSREWQRKRKRKRRRRRRREK